MGGIVGVAHASVSPSENGTDSLSCFLMAVGRVTRAQLIKYLVVPIHGNLPNCIQLLMNDTVCGS